MATRRPPTSTCRSDAVADRIVRDNYLQMTALPCENMHDTNFAFNSLQESGVYPD